MNVRLQTSIDRLSIEELRDSRDAWWSAEFDDFLCSALEPAGANGILDVGCGIGTLAQHLGPRLPPGTRITGVDLDLPRLRLAACAGRSAAAGARGCYAAADGCTLPFRDGLFGASVTILTLQHVAEPARVLSEMRRVSRAGGVVAAVEADNTGQRLYVPSGSPRLDVALTSFWRAIQERSRPADIAIGPRLPHLFCQVGLRSPSVRGYLLTYTSWVEPQAFVGQARARFYRVARRHGVEESRECEVLIETIEELAVKAPGPFCAISTVPLFLVASLV